MHRSVTVTCAKTFNHLENEKVLDPLTEVDLYCLHYVYMPRMCKQISEFQESWNIHPLSTEGSKSPYQRASVVILNVCFKMVIMTCQHKVEKILKLNANDPVNVVRNCSTSPRSTPYAHYRICMKIIFKIEKSNSNDSRILNF